MNKNATSYWGALAAAVGLLAVAGCGIGSQNVPTEGQDSVYEAAFRGELTYVSSFVNDGFDVDTPDENGRTLLHYAAAGDQTYMLETLLEEFGADGTIRDKDGKTPADIARERQAANALWYLEEDQGL